MKSKLVFSQLEERRVGRVAQPGRKRRPLVVLLDDIRSLHNVGAIFRTADGVYLEHLYLCGITGAPPRNEIRKTSLGAEESVPWSYHPDPVAVVAGLRDKGYQIVVLEQTDDAVDYRQADYHFPLCLVLGHEYNGVRDELVAAADLAIEIPMHGEKHSLNVSVAFGIAIYNICSMRDDIDA